MITGKKIILTGANSGIGLEVLKLLVKGDNKILAVDLFTDKIETFDKSKVIPMVCDLSTKENVDAMFDKAIAELGQIDICYANAGYPYYEKMDYVNWERVEDMFKVNVFSPIYTTQKYVEYLNGKQGHMAITVSAIGKMASALSKMAGSSLSAWVKRADNHVSNASRKELLSAMPL